MPKAKPQNYLPELLNRVEAIIDCEAGSVSELAEFLLPEQDKRQAVSRVAEWIRSRQRKPNGETALRMQEWAARKTLEITADKKKGKAYRTAFDAVQTRRKSND